MESGIQLKESGIPLTTGIQNSSSTDKNWNPVPGIRNPQRGIQNPRLSWISLYGVILNTLKCVLPTSFRVALVCNYPALCSLYASRVGFKTVRILICVVAFACLCCSIVNKQQTIKKVQTYNQNRLGRLENIPGGSCLILLLCRYLQE